MFELLFIVGIFTGLSLSLYFTIKIFPVDIDLDNHLEKEEGLATVHRSKL